MNAINTPATQFKFTVIDIERDVAELKDLLDGTFQGINRWEIRDVNPIKFELHFQAAEDSVKSAPAYRAFEKFLEWEGGNRGETMQYSLCRLDGEAWTVIEQQTI